MVVSYDFLFLEIYCHLGDLLFGWHQFASLPLLAHLQDLHLGHVVVIIKIVFGRVYCLRFVFNKINTPSNDLVISVLIQLSRLLSYLLYPLDESVVVPVGIEGYDPHASVDFDHLLPVR